MRPRKGSVNNSVMKVNPSRQFLTRESSASEFLKMETMSSPWQEKPIMSALEISGCQGMTWRGQAQTARNHRLVSSSSSTSQFCGGQWCVGSRFYSDRHWPLAWSMCISSNGVCKMVEMWLVMDQMLVFSRVTPNAVAHRMYCTNLSATLNGGQLFYMYPSTLHSKLF